MSTRAKVIVQDEEGEALCVMYKHYDGYPDGFGRELAEFVAPRGIVNGIPFDAEQLTIANGMEDLAAQIVCYFKSQVRGGVGDVYLQGPDPHADFGQDYTYVVYPIGDGRAEIALYDRSGRETLLLDMLDDPEKYGG